MKIGIDGNLERRYFIYIVGWFDREFEKRVLYLFRVLVVLCMVLKIWICNKCNFYSLIKIYVVLLN